MKIQEIIDRIIAYHPDLGDRLATTCDTIKYGDPDQECTGIATAIYASTDIIKKAAELKCNMILVHEPAFYDHMDPLDWLEHNSVAQAKMKLLDEAGIVIFRDHDRIHAHQPDGIMFGMTTEMGWQPYLMRNPMAKRIPGSGDLGYNWQFPEPIPVKEIAEQFIEKLHLNNIQLIGNPNTMVKRVMLGGHLTPGNKAFIDTFDRSGCDLLIPGETIDWEINEYFKDAGGLGMNKAMLRIGHFNMEELGMKNAVNWVSKLVEYKVPVVYVPNNDMYQYVR